MPVTQTKRRRVSPLPDHPPKDKPPPAPQLAKPAPEKPAATAYVRLVNECRTYVTPNREVFYAKDNSGVPLIYPVKREDLSRFLSYRDDYGRAFFVEAQVKGGRMMKIDSTDKPERIVASQPSGPAGTIDEAPPVTEEITGETDTGITRLVDGDGNEVGVVV